MPNPTYRKDLSFKALELFQICARQGSLQATADEAGLSISTVSHHLRGLEEHLGVALFDHQRKPLVLTPKGHAFLRNTEQALQTIRTARAEAATGSSMGTSLLRIGAIEDLENDVMPDLAVHLSQELPNCNFVYQTASSREIISMLRNRTLDLGITSSPAETLKGLEDHALLRDPFVLVLPAKTQVTPADALAGRSELPLLQFSSDLMIANQIEAHLKRLGVFLPHRFECASNQTLMAMVAAAAGWAITTPLLFARARRFQPQLRMHPFPGKQFARRLSVITTPDCAPSAYRLADDKIRMALHHHVIAPMHRTAPWLEDRLAVLA